jgi:hypothetical protein
VVPSHYRRERWFEELEGPTNLLPYGSYRLR